jgi:hypothetical protein
LRKRGSSVAVCCGPRPWVVLTFKNGLLEHAFVVDSLEELREDSRFWEVMYQDSSCPELGLRKTEVSEELRRLACSLRLALEALFGSSSS